MLAQHVMPFEKSVHAKCSVYFTCPVQFLASTEARMKQLKSGTPNSCLTARCTLLVLHLLLNQDSSYTQQGDSTLPEHMPCWA